MDTDITWRQMQAAAAPAAKPGGPDAPARRERIGTGDHSVAAFGDVLRERITSDQGPAAGTRLLGVISEGRDNALAAAPAAEKPLKMSAHAQTRLSSRNITWGANEVARLHAAVARAESKGARESLVLLDGTALVVSVKNRTVITAVDAASLKDNVFTNIDSAVIG